MENLNKGNAVVSGVSSRARQLALIALLLVQPAVLHAQEASLKAAADKSQPADAPVVASLFTVVQPSGFVPMNSVSAARPAAIAPVVAVTIPSQGKNPEAHPFWDRENRALFAANGALATADFFVTRRNLSSSGVELNPLTRMFSHSTPALAANFALETGGVVGVSYLFHKTGHHKLERMTSYVNLSASGFAVGYGLAHH